MLFEYLIQKYLLKSEITIGDGSALITGILLAFNLPAGLPIWMIISWIYDISPEGIEKTLQVSENEMVAEATNKRLNLFIIVSLSIAVIVMGLKLSNVFSSDDDKQYAIAVLPFKDRSPEDAQRFCDGVMDEVLKHFSTMKNLRVISRTSSDTYKGTDKKIRQKNTYIKSWKHELGC